MAKGTRPTKGSLRTSQQAPTTQLITQVSKKTLRLTNLFLIECFLCLQRAVASQC